jgi:hypothetical protein
MYILGSVAASSDTNKSEGRQMKLCLIIDLQKKTKKYNVPLILGMQDI